MFLWSVLILITAYLIGALPSAYIIGSYYGVNLRNMGDGNLGARNTYQVLGWKPALMVGFLDLGKGAFATWLATLLLESRIMHYLAGLAAILGHDFSIYIHFAGGQGMAANLGSLIVLQPRETLLGIAIALLALLLFRNWDFAWVLGLGGVVALSYIYDRPLWQLVMIALMFVSIGFKKLIDLPLAHSLHNRNP